MAPARTATPTAPDAPSSRCQKASDSAFARSLRGTGTLYACPAGQKLIGGTHVGDRGGVAYFRA